MLVFLFFLVLFVVFEIVVDGLIFLGGYEDDYYVSLLLVEGLLSWGVIFVILGVVGGVIFVGIYFVCFMFCFIDKVGLCEMYMVLVFLIVVGIGFLMMLVGLLVVFGIFFVGVVFVNFEFCYEFESDIELFKGLFLGIFFIIVGV